MAKRLVRPDQDRFLRKAKGVVHVGANTGQERAEYATHNLPVLWIEPIPSVFAELKENLRAFPNQLAIQALVTDVDGNDYEFKVASNGGASSSILDLKLHKDIWPEVHYVETIALKSVTLASLFRESGFSPGNYDALVMDTQGSELLVLQGAGNLLSGFRFIKTEVADFEAYAGCCLLEEVEAFMLANGFIESSRAKYATRPDGGTYFNVVYSARTTGRESTATKP